MSITANYANLKPSLLMDFSNSQQLDSRVTFSRSTTAPYYDGKTSVLAEQNLFTYSQDFSNGTWAKQNATFTYNATTAPDATTTGTNFIPNTSNVNHAIYYSTRVTIINVANTLSVYVKANGYTLFQICDVSNSQFNAIFDLTAVTATNILGTTPSIVSVGNGWYRCIITFTPIVYNNVGFQPLPASSTASNYGNTYAGDNTNGVYIWGAQLEQRSSVTAYNATTTSAITNYIPQLLTAPINQPRFDFNPTSGESLGLLIEQSSTNLFYPSVLGTFTGGNLVSNGGVAIAPDGTQNFSHINLTAGTLYDANNSSGYNPVPQGNFTNQTYTWTIYAKAAEITSMAFRNNWIGGLVVFNLANGTITLQNYGTSTITLVGNGVYRCSVTYTAPSTSTNGISFKPYVSGGTSDGYSGIYIWGTQIEALAFPTSYIPTTSAQVTRASDIDSMPTSGWYNQAQGTFYTNVYDSQNTARAFTLDDGTSSSNQIAIGYDTSRIRVNAVDVGNFYTNTLVTGQRTIAYNTNQQSASNNGASLSSTTSSPVPPNMTTLRIGQSSSGSFLNGHIRKFAFYPIQFTTANQQALTGS